jgi:hypothetical protein
MALNDVRSLLEFPSIVFFREDTVRSFLFYFQGYMGHRLWTAAERVLSYHSDKISLHFLGCKQVVWKLSRPKYVQCLPLSSIAM